MKLSISALALMMFVACAPSKYTMHLETRYPSKSGLDLAGKNVSVIYLENGTEFKDGFSASMAESLAYNLEKDYGTGEGSVGVFRMTKSAGGDYASKDTLFNLLMDTGSDLVFLIDTIRFGEMTVGGPSKVSYATVPDSSTVNLGSIPFNLRLYSYDAMNASEEVKNFGGTAIAQPEVYSNGTLSSEQLKAGAYKALPAEGWAAGEMLSKSFASQWKVEGYSIIYFDSPKWIAAAEKARIKAEKKAAKEAARKKKQEERETRWAELDKRDAEKAAAKEAKRLEKERQRKKDALEKAARQAERDAAVLEKYRLKFEQKKAKEESRSKK